MGTLREEIMACADKQVQTLEGGRGYELVFHFDEHFIGFQGHFPGHPVLPAFVQVLMGQCALCLRSGRNWRLRRVDRSKFLKTILPGRPVKVCWQEQPLNGTLRCSFALLADGEKAAAFTVEFDVEDGRHA
jgi:3-hydroxyacyl-[acyl-carrier-protein] dehydratase